MVSTTVASFGGIPLANYKCVIRYVVDCNWLVQCGIITDPGDKKMDILLYRLLSIQRVYSEY